MIFRSPHPDVDIPDVSLPEFVLAGAGRQGDKPAIVDAATGRGYTYAEIDTNRRRLAAGLAARGLTKGEVVAILCPNLPEYPIAFLGVATAGGVNTTLNPLYTADEIGFQLRDSGARFLITVPALLDKAREAAAKASVEEVYVIGEAEGATPFTSLYGDLGATPQITFDPAEDLVALPYSSGTTGFSKGVMLTHRNLVANLCQTGAVQSITEDEKVIAVLPFFHIYGMVVIMLQTLWRGATVVAMPRFELEPALKAIQDYRISRLYFAPPIVVALAKHPAVAAYDMSSVKLVFSGAAPLDAETAELCSRRIGCRVSQGYGMTEASPVTHSVPDWAEKVIPGSVGPCVPNTECKVIDIATGEELGVGQDGEIWIRGPQIMKGYLNNIEATRESLDADGFYHTGDIGHADQNGEFYIVDRLKELIKYKGYQVPPAELEAVLLSNPAVADAAVIPVPDEEAGELPKGYVVLKEGHQATAEELIEYVASRVAPHKRIRLIEFTDAIPKSASGKILRRVLVDRERARRAAAGAE